MALRWLSIYALLTYPFVCVPFLYFHFQAHGVSVAQYHDMLAVYYVTMVVAEVPTGLFADRLGRKQAMAIGPCVLAAGYLCFLAGGSYGMFCLGQALLGIGHALISGPPSALLYDTLHTAGRGEEFLHLEGRLQALRLLGTAGAFLLGGVLSQLAGISAAIWATAALHGLGVLAALRLVEPPRPHALRTRELWRTAQRDLLQPSLLWLCGYFALLFFLLRYCFHTYQPFLDAARAREPLFVGALYAALNLLAAPCSRLAAPCLRRFGAPVVYAAMPLLLAMSLLGMAAFVDRWAILGIALQQVPFGMHWSIVQAFANRRLQPAARTTALSAISFCARIGFAALFPCIGRVHEAHGIASAYVLVALAGTGLALVTVAGGRHWLRAG